MSRLRERHALQERELQQEISKGATEHRKRRGGTKASDALPLSAAATLERLCGTPPSFTRHAHECTASRAERGDVMEMCCTIAEGMANLNHAPIVRAPRMTHYRFGRTYCFLFPRLLLAAGSSVTWLPLLRCEIEKKHASQIACRIAVTVIQRFRSHLQSLPDVWTPAVVPAQVSVQIPSRPVSPFSN